MNVEKKSESGACYAARHQFRFCQIAVAVRRCVPEPEPGEVDPMIAEDVERILRNPTLGVYPAVELNLREDRNIDSLEKRWRFLSQ